MRIEIPAFADGEEIPTQFSKKGGNRSPAVEFKDVPRQARSLVLIMDDPDAPNGLFTHWVVFDIDPGIGGFRENMGVGTLARNSWDEAAYGGPQPPDREHRYFFHLYALDTRLELASGAGRAEVEREMEGHVIDEAVTMGRYAPHTAELAGRH